MGHGHEDDIDVLARELDAVNAVLEDLTDADWARPTHLVPEGEGLARWRVADLVAHIDISIGLTLGLLDSIQTGQPGRDRASFFIADRSRVAPVVYDYAVKHAAEQDRAGLVERTRATFAASLDGIRQHPPDTIGSGFFALMRLDEWVPTRVVEAVVHGIDLTDALDRTSVATPAGTTMTAAILDDVLARRTVAGRPPDLADDVTWVRAASGRSPHPDPRLPLIV
ncbi:maleylpyruvate isomerase N-terminal domain-containing protein [Geodermatophilus sp. SYSU D00965]